MTCQWHCQSRGVTEPAGETAGSRNTLSDEVLHRNCLNIPPHPALRATFPSRGRLLGDGFPRRSAPRNDKHCHCEEAQRADAAIRRRFRRFHFRNGVNTIAHENRTAHLFPIEAFASMGSPFFAGFRCHPERSDGSCLAPGGEVARPKAVPERGVPLEGAATLPSMGRHFPAVVLACGRTEHRRRRPLGHPAQKPFAVLSALTN